jgi:hypothetical protein
VDQRGIGRVRVPERLTSHDAIGLSRYTLWVARRRLLRRQQDGKVRQGAWRK